MPLIKVERIISFSSEDPIHTANNILLTDTSKKWKCKVPGEKSASIVLQLDQPYIISGIDIGNEHSAYIEVLVTRSNLPGDYKVLLVMSSFMTPLEARQSQNVNKVRMFKQVDFSEPEKSEKWDRVMIVCTQPFNRHTQYGLSFINFYTIDKNLVKPLIQPLIGKFAIRPVSPENISTGNLFVRSKEHQEITSEPALRGAAAIREATSLSQIVSPAVKHKFKNNSSLTINLKVTDSVASLTDKADFPKPRNRNELLYTSDEDDEHGKFSKFENKLSRNVDINKHNKQEDSSLKGCERKISDHEERKKAEPNKNIRVSTKTKKDNQKHNSLHDEQSSHKHSGKFKHNRKLHHKKVIGKPFARLLEDVVFVISGIQNPERARLRSIALSMGAKYQADWDTTCTHLICAFTNTPKFNLVKGKGKIVKKNWLEDCYNKRKRLPWRRYSLDNADKGLESEEEICEQDIEDLENFNSESNSDVGMEEGGSDTGDRVEQIIKKQKQTSLFKVDTDSELVNTAHNDLMIQKRLKNFFIDNLFYVDKGFEGQKKNRIKQYVVAYGGILVDNIQPGVNIITNKSNYKNLREVYSEATYIAPDWIWKCHNCQEVVPVDDYIFK